MSNCIVHFEKNAPWCIPVYSIPVYSIHYKLNFAGQVSYVCWKYIQSDSLYDSTPEYTLKNQRISVFLLFPLLF